MKNRIQLIREEKNLTQSELAEKSGLSLRTIQRIEAGSIPKGYTLKSLASALETEPGNLISTIGQTDMERVKLINISSLVFVIVPFGNIIIPAILIFRTSNAGARKMGLSLLSLQLIWTVFTSLSMMAIPLLHKMLPTRIPLFLLILLLLMACNVTLILKNAISLSRNNELYFSLNNSLL